MSRAMVGTVKATLPLLAAVAVAQSSGKPVALDWNTDGGIGPDGPWNYLKVNVGSGPGSTVWFYPEFGSDFTSITRSDACSKGTTCLSPTPGYYNQNAVTAKSSGKNINMTTVPGSPNYDATGNFYGWVDSMATSNGDINASNVALAVYPNTSQSVNKKSYVPLSFLSMEPWTINAKITDSDGMAVNSTTMLAEYVATSGGSTTMSLHMGVASANQSGSLLFGGYDQNRLIETPFKFGNLGPVPLTSISFGTTSGQTPWQHSTGVPSNLLDQFLSSSAGNGNNLTLLLSPNTPYLSLPHLVCDRIHQFMPTTFDSDTNLYLWDTTQPSYNDYISSPSYLNFTFGTGASAASIKVPFAALNQNLTSPLRDSPTPYFPCQSHDEPAEMNLGRAFLQSAFLMQSWNPNDLTKGQISLGQAPGPGGSSGSSIQTLLQQNPDAEPGQNAPKWEDTWSQLKPLGSASTVAPGAGSSSNTDDSHHGLSGGAIAGIVIGVLAGVALIAGAAAFFFLRRRRAAKAAAGGAYAPAETSDMAQAPAAAAPGAAATTATVPPSETAGAGATKYSANGASELQPTGAVKYGGGSQLPAASELGGSTGYHEMESGSGFHEMDGTIPGHATAYEMPDTSMPHEMGTNSRF